MRIASNASRLRRRIGFWRTGLIARLLALLALAEAGCGAATPAQMATSPSVEPTSGESDITSAPRESPAPHFPQQHDSEGRVI